MSELLTVELCAGIAGFSSEHTRCLAYVEIDPMCRAVLRRHHPNALTLDDVRKAGGHNLPRADIVKFGFPCQDLSVAGKRAGLAGARSGLFYECLRNIYELQPRLAVWENVPGLYSSCSCRRCRRHCADCGNITGADEDTCLVCGGDKLRGRVLRGHRGADLFAIVSALGYVGYAGAWTLLDAQYFGVAQRRQRIFGVFARADLGAERCAEILSLATRMRGDFETSGETRADVAPTLESGTNRTGGTRPPGTTVDTAETLIPFDTTQITSAANRSAPQAGDPCHPLAAQGHPPAITFDFQASQAGNDSSIADPPGRTRSLKASRQLAVMVGERVASALTHHHGRNSGEDTLIGFNFKGAFDASGADIAPTMTHGGTGGGTSRIAASSPALGVRRLTPVECERLQGFDDDYTAWGIDEAGQRIEMSDSARYRMLGNAVNRKVSKWLDLQIRKVLG